MFTSERDELLLQIGQVLDAIEKLEPDIQKLSYRTQITLDGNSLEAIYISPEYLISRLESSILLIYHENEEYKSLSSEKLSRPEESKIKKQLEVFLESIRGDLKQIWLDKFYPDKNEFSIAEIIEFADWSDQNFPPLPPLVSD